ncbi:hypothetical protein MKZ38_006407 [Zalerion maritima]|uniref:C2H2-type domain-containing protein n=1 Tax=Zalerion maritima TaxID=339359 RepID=A0AAD5WNQ8_9PEZI|nr:hypothetical protein MKZ38_006407 [Zalerion maritima]
MSESADELSTVRPDLRIPSRKRGRPRRPGPAGPAGTSKTTATVSPVKFEIQLASRPIPTRPIYVQPGGDSSTSASAAQRGGGPKKRGRPKGSTVANILARHHSTAVGTARRPGRPPKDANSYAFSPWASHHHRNRIGRGGTGAVRAGVQKKRGRPAFVPKSARQYYLESKSDAPFVTHPCLWEGCKAELMNLETLRRHVGVVHGPPPLDSDWALRSGSEDSGGSEGTSRSSAGRGSGHMRRSWSRSRSEESEEPPMILGCRWGKCASVPERRQRTWTDVEEWEKHVEEEHLIPYSWHLGDGVKNTSLSGKLLDFGKGKEKGEAESVEDKGKEKRKKKTDALPEWLFDKDGNQVTPDARFVQVEDQATAAQRATRLRELRRLINDNAPEEEEEKEEKEKEEKEEEEEE